MVLIKFRNMDEGLWSINDVVEAFFLQNELEELKKRNPDNEWDDDSKCFLQEDSDLLEELFELSDRKFMYQIYGDESYYRVFELDLD